MQRQRVSIEDVARRAKVSITTVSRVINNVPTVSPANRARIEEAIAFYKFKPNVSAQRLARGVTNAIGLVMPGYPGIFHSFYGMEVIRGVGHACEAARLDLIFHITNGLNAINSSAVGGIVFADIIENRRQVENALEQGVPCVVINNRVDDGEINYIAVDNFLGGQLAAEYLLNLGHQRIATITGNINTQAGAQRLEGFKEFLESRHAPVPKEYIYLGDYSRRSARQGAEQLMALKAPPTAVFAASDEMALEVMAFVFEKGLKVPQDVSIIGFDDNPACLYAPAALTTIKQPLFHMAEESVRLLHAIISGKGKVKNKNILSPELIVRESTCPPKK